MARTAPRPSPGGMWTADVAAAWLATLGIPGDPGVRLERELLRGHDRVLRYTPAPGARGGRTAGEEASRDTSWKAFQLAARGRQRGNPKDHTDSDRDAEAIALDAHVRLIRAPTGVWLPAGTGRVWLTRGGLSWPPGGPAPMGPVPDDAERNLWTCTYLVRVIEYPTP